MKHACAITVIVSLALLTACRSSGTAPNVAVQQKLFVGNCGDSCSGSGSSNIAIYKPPYTGSPATTLSVGQPWALAFDSSGNLWVANSYGANTVTEYASPYTGTPIATITTDVNQPQGLATSK